MSGSGLVYYLPPIIAALAVMVAALRDVRRAPERKQPIRAAMAVCALYLFMLYVGIAAGWWDDAFFVRAGYATRIGVTLALILVVIEIVFDGRDNDATRTY